MFVVSYSDAFSSPIDEVRHLLGDVDPDAPLLTDAEIAYELGASGGSTQQAAVRACDRITARCAALADTTELDLSVMASQLFDHYTALAKILGAAFSPGIPSSVIPYAGGLSRVDARGRDQNADAIPPLFDRDIPGGRTAPFIGKWPEGWR